MAFRACSSSSLRAACGFTHGTVQFSSTSHFGRRFSLRLRPRPCLCSKNLHASTSASDDDDHDAAQYVEKSSSIREDELPALVPKGDLECGLYLVATPIGNLEDITLRALRVLKSVDLILSEDTRHSAKLLQHYNIRTPSLSYHKYNEAKRASLVLERLRHGGALALISDAGMPGISDPGAELVMACVDANVRMFPIPGPSAVITALVAAGLPTNEFSFVGFLSAQATQRKSRLSAASNETSTQVLYVPPHKLCAVLEDCKAIFGPSRRCVVAREMTKIHEEFWRGTLEEAVAEFSSRVPRGEITLVIQGWQKDYSQEPTDEDIQLELEKAMANGFSMSEAAKLVTQKISVKKKRVYEIALKLPAKAQHKQS
ncbi:hypothetical protein GOP47_0026459 [Adiantum capillus-veneris]|nr:hypothetical protein GOP47_0026459 [Adiantum capillus-veneris]